MAQGKRTEVKRDTLIEAIYESYGTLTKAAFILGDMNIRTLYNLIDIENLWGEVDKARHVESQIRDDMALSAIDKLAQRLEDEPAVALKAAHLTLTRRGGTRKDWVPKESNGEDTSEKDKELHKDFKDTFAYLRSKSASKETAELDSHTE